MQILGMIERKFQCSFIDESSKIIDLLKVCNHLSSSIIVENKNNVELYSNNQNDSEGNQNQDSFLSDLMAELKKRKLVKK